MPNLFICSACSEGFNSFIAFDYHCRYYGHGNCCAPCKRWFVNVDVLLKHLRDSPNHQFDHEDEMSYGFEACQDDNMDVDRMYCDVCNRWVVNLCPHLRERLVLWCDVCSRGFKTENGLSSHNNSLAHKKRELQCIFCKEMFKSPSGVASHIESGCHNITRQQVTAAVHSLNIVPTISISYGLPASDIHAQDPPSPSSSSSSSTTTLSTSNNRTEAKTDKMIATEASFNRRAKAYQCFISPCKRKFFRTLHALNHHLNSPAHDIDEFKCPQCKRQFKLISALVRHIESGVCHAAEMKKVEEYYEDLTEAFTRALKL